VVTRHEVRGGVSAAARVLLSAALIGAVPEGVLDADTSAPGTLMHDVLRVHQADHEAWGKYAFDRHVTRRSLDEDGNVVFQEELHFHVAPSGDGFDEQLYEIDGRAPTGKEVLKHRRARRFTRHYEQAAAFEWKNPIGPEIEFDRLILSQPHRLLGDDEIDGISCRRIEFDPQPEAPDRSATEKLEQSLRGSGCLAKEIPHIRTIAFESTRSIEKWPAELFHLGFRLEKRPLDGAWLPTRIEVRSGAKLLGRKLRQWNEYRYDHYRRVED
jgi:hypothetical protein